MTKCLTAGAAPKRQKTRIENLPDNDSDLKTKLEIMTTMTMTKKQCYIKPEYLKKLSLTTGQSYHAFGTPRSWNTKKFWVMTDDDVPVSFGTRPPWLGQLFSCNWKRWNPGDCGLQVRIGIRNLSSASASASPSATLARPRGRKPGPLEPASSALLNHRGSTFHLAP